MRQATIYDDLHMGDFIAVVVNFVNQKTEHADGGVRLTVAYTCHGFRTSLSYATQLLLHSCRSYMLVHG